MLTEPRDQGHCGSCYTHGFIQSLEARLRIKTGNKNIPKLSVQQMLNCNFLNEGCAGGWPHLNGYFAEQAYLVSEECAGYKAQTKGNKCKDFEKCKPIAKVQQTHKVGGFGLGQVSETDIMKEMLRNGPVSVEFDAKAGFAIYKEGILTKHGLDSIMKQKIQQSLSEEDKDSMTQENLDQMVTEAIDNGTESSLLQLSAESKPSYNKKTMEDTGMSWVEQSHTVLLAGWGFHEPTNTKYWIVRNSYGSKWGQGGDFMIEKGVNMMGIEADIVAFDPVMCSEASTESCFVA